MPVYQIETARCVLRPLTIAEAPALHRLWTRPDVRRYLWDDQVIPEDETVRLLHENARLFTEEGFGLWGFRLLGADDLIGFGGYWYFRDPPERELILGLAPEHWGRGLATEAGGALIRFAFDVLGLDEVRASTDAPNQAAVRVMERLAMRFDRRATVDGLDTRFYILPRALWHPSEARYILSPGDNFGGPEEA